MSTQRLTQIIHPNHKHLNQITVVVLVVIGSLIMGLIPLIAGSGSIDTQGDNLIIPTEAELWSSLGEAIE